MPNGEERRYRVVAVFDTETSNVPLDRAGTVWRALPVAYIVNDLRDVDLRRYTPDACHEHVHLWRYAEDMHRYLDELVQAGRERGYVPVVCAYNLGFDLQTIIYELSKRYRMIALARSSTHVYTCDLVDEEGAPLLRFWDCFHLETGGLAQMGRVCDFPKALGEWDYSLIRSPETPLTDEEIDYATRDVQIIPAYLRYLLDAGEVSDPADFGFRVITKTSLVRQMARRDIGKYPVLTAAGNRTNLLWLYQNRCKAELPYSYNAYALRKACFRGGLTFTAARTASTVQFRVQSWDVTSMHHLYLNGRRVPVEFRPASIDDLAFAVETVMSRSLADVLRRYDCPFAHAFHVVIEFENIRLRAGSPFERQGIGLLAAGKFDRTDGEALDFEPDLRNVAAEDDVRAAGFRDDAFGAVFAFGKLMSAKTARVHLSEVELWNVSRVYEWDSYRIVTGELTIKTVTPPDYVSMQSNVLFTRKSDAKRIVKNYTQGEPYPLAIPASIPEGIAARLRAGTMNADVLEAWYNVTVKGAFNGIYGTQAQDQLRPDFVVEEGEFLIDDATRVTPDNFFEKLPKKTTVWYTYGLRIVAGSRMHLVIAMELLEAAFGDGVDVLGGDTDSLKIRVDPEISREDILEALRPLHDAADRALERCQSRNRTLYPEQAAAFEDLGHFDFEGEAELHYEAWNKARVQIADGVPHITCAGLMRPPDSYHIEHWIRDMCERYSPLEVLSTALGYNGVVDYSICYAREHYRPEAADRFQWTITDCNGERSQPDVYQAIAIYPSSREIGGTVKEVNRQNVRYLEQVYGYKVDTRQHVITLEDGEPALYREQPGGELVRIW